MEPAHLDLWNTSLEKENMGYAFCNVCFSQHLYEAVVGNVKLKHYSATASSGDITSAAQVLLRNRPNLFHQYDVHHGTS